MKKICVVAAVAVTVGFTMPHPALAQSTEPPADQKKVEQPDDQAQPQTPRRRTRRHHHGHDHDHDHDHDHAHVKKVKKKPSQQTAHEHAHARPHGPGEARDGHDHAHKHHGVETEHLFGFTAGSDVHPRGTKEITFDTTGRFRRRSGQFTAVTNAVEFGYSPTDNLHVALELWTDYFSIHNVPDLDDRQHFAFGGVAGEIKLRLLDRRSAPIGLTVMVEPLRPV